MAFFKVTAEELRSAAKKISTAADNYETASNAAMNAADTLAGSWEGDAQEIFVEEQGNAKVWYAKMAEIARNYSTYLNTTADEYEQADAEAAETIGRV